MVSERPHSPNGYRYIEAWGRVKGLGSEAVDNLQAEAFKVMADPTACFRRIKKSRDKNGEEILVVYWVLFQDLSVDEKFMVESYLLQSPPGGMAQA